MLVGVLMVVIVVMPVEVSVVPSVRDGSVVMAHGISAFSDRLPA
jgi:hypothetical protein